MRLEPGSSVGPYTVVAALGAGGMGEVYSARDAKLNRLIALKVLPQRFSSDPLRLERFKREALVLASLNHPNIASIHGFEDGGDIQALVLELVDGPTLADRIARRAMPLDEVLRISRQIAEALEAAHGLGIIHRDLKPANIKLRPDGTVKVLDFGLAKALDPALSGADVKAPTVTAAMGTILGTAAYMSPERAHGEAADRRDDIWAFGCVLYEMLTGRPAFTGDTVSDTLSNVLKSEPDWSRLPPETPPAVRRLLRRCLQKAQTRRLHHMGDARLELEEASASPAMDDNTTGRRAPRRQERLLVSALAVVALFAAVQSVRLWRQVSSVSPAPERRLEINTGTPVAGNFVGGVPQAQSIAISPDGLKIVYAASSEGPTQLWLRSLDSVSARPLAGTNLGLLPFWSPDSRSIGFFAEDQLKRIDIDGGTVKVLANAPFGVGGAWNSDGTILFAPIFSGPIFRIEATGGEASVVTRLERPQANHRLPQFLPDGHHFVYHVTGAPETAGVYVSRLDGTGSERLLEADMAAVHKVTNQLLFVRQGTLFAQPFGPNWTSLAGSPSPVAEQVAGVSVADAGPIAYSTRSGNVRRQLVWFDRSGKEISRVGNADRNLSESSGEPDLSPDGRTVTLSRIVDGNPDIWLVDSARGVFTRFTSENAANYAPKWSPDGRRLVFNSNRSGVFDLYLKPAMGVGTEELLLATSQSKSAADWSPDGRFLLFRSVDPVTSHDLWAMPLDGDRKPFPVVRTNFIEPYGQFSPDGKWIAYQSNESGRAEVYVQAFPEPGLKIQISTNGGAQMHWRRDGKELFYIALDGQLMTVPIRHGPEDGNLEAGAPVPLFATNVGETVPLQSGANHSYTVSSDGQRFLMNTIVESPRPSPIIVILNWRPKQ